MMGTLLPETCREVEINILRSIVHLFGLIWKRLYRDAGSTKHKHTHKCVLVWTECVSFRLGTSENGNKALNFTDWENFLTSELSLTLNLLTWKNGELTIMPADGRWDLTRRLKG